MTTATGLGGHGVDGVDRALVERAAALKPLLAEHAARTEAERRVVPEVIDALEDAGLFDLMPPKRVGGAGVTMATQLAVAAELGEACASTAWVQSLINVTTWGAARSPAGVGLFDASERLPRVCGVLAPTGTAEPAGAGDGYVVRGRWPFASGSFHADWFIAGVLVVDDAGQPRRPAMVVVPRRDFAIEDTWFVAGMCGTGSDTVVMDGAQVPGVRLAFLDEEPFGGSGGSGDPGEPGDRWPLGSVLTLVLVGPLLGAARACAGAVTDKAPGRAISYTSYGATTDSMVALSELARARLDVDTAGFHAFEAAAYIDAVGAGADRDPLAEARLRGQCGYLVALLRRSVEGLLDVAGAGSFASASAVQRHWRDLNVGSRHAFLATNPSLETYGRALFGLDPILAIV